MNLRTLLAAARAQGWKHTIYDGSFGIEHVWERGEHRIALESRITIDGTTYTRMVVDLGFAEQFRGRVKSADQAAKLLAAYDITADQAVAGNPAAGGVTEGSAPRSGSPDPIAQAHSTLPEGLFR